MRLGIAEVRDTFKVPKFGTIAGCMVTEGRITRAGDTQARLLRDNVVVHEGKIGSLRRFKDDCQRGEGRIRVRHRLRQVTTTSRSATSSRCSSIERVADDGVASARIENQEAFDFVIRLRVAFMPKAPVPTASAIRSGASSRALLTREVHDPGIGFLT